MKITATRLAEVLVVEPKVFSDERGFFFESYSQPRFTEAGIDCVFVQDNHARSARGTIRGLHYQREPGQAKLLRATRGAVFDVAVDIRPSSPGFGRWVGVELSEDNHLMLFVPVGFAHGYAALSEITEVQYKVSQPYDAVQEATIAYDDPTIGVDWPFAEPTLSRRDRHAPSLRETFPDMF